MGSWDIVLRQTSEKVIQHLFLLYIFSKDHHPLSETFAHHFMVIEMVLHPFYFLIILMSLTGNENHIAFFRHHTCRADSLTAVNDGEHFLHLLGIETSQHIIDNVLRLLKAGIIARNDYAVALLHRLFRHQGTFAFIAVATSTTDRYHTSPAVQHFMNGIEHIFQGIRSVGIVNDCRIALRRSDGIQSAIDTLQRAENHQHILRTFPQHNSSAIYGKQIAHIEFPDELHAHLTTVNLQIHSFEMTFDNSRTEICHLSDRIRLHLCLCVLCQE